MKVIVVALLVVAGCLVITAPLAAADEAGPGDHDTDAAVQPSAAAPAPNGAPAGGGQSLAQAAEDPTASLMSLQIADWYTASFHHLDDEDANSVVLRPVVPFKTGPLKHIFRATVPFITNHPLLDAGISDMTLFDLIVFNQSWGRWGIGPVALLPSGGEDRGADKWALGPALGFTARHKKLLWGLFNQNLFSFAGDGDRSDVNASVMQPILNYGLGHGWSAGSSEMTFAYDWEASRWSSLPLGAKVSKLVKFGTVPVQFGVQYEYDFANDESGPQNTTRFTVKFLFPR